MDRRQFNRLVTGAAAASALSGPVIAAGLVNKPAEQLKTGEFNWFPNRSPSGPLLIIVSLPDQLVHVYRNGIRIAASTCSSGKPGHGTPTGVFKILQKDKHHRSSTYNNAPMPNMNRLTWSGVALHAGNLPGYPASHGCVRLPMQFSELLFGITRLGMTVVIADRSTQPDAIVHPGMVLGDYAAREFAAVDTAVMKHAYSEGQTDTPTSASVVISRADRSVSVWENGRIVASGKAEFQDHHRPVGNRVYTLTGAYSDKKSVRWVSSNFSGRHSGEGDLASLQRIKAEPKVREEIRKRMHHGMTVVTTDQPASAEYRTADDFVIFRGIY